MVSKLTVCVYPMATVLPGVTAITGLDNYNLADQPVFDAATVRLINTFLARLPGRLPRRSSTIPGLTERGLGCCCGMPAGCVANGARASQRLLTHLPVIISRRP